MALKYFRWRSLKTRVTLYTLAIFLVGIWSLAFYASRMLRADMQRVLGEQQLSTAAIVAAQVNDELVTRLGALAKSAARVTPAILGNTAAIQARLDENPALGQLFNGGVVVIGADGTAIAEIPHSLGVIGVNLIDRDHIVGALKEGMATIGRPVMGRKLRSPIVAIAVPIRDPQGKVIGALSGLTDLGEPNFLDQFTGSNYGKSGGYLLVAPQHRVIVTASDKSRVMEAYPATGTSPSIERRIQGREGSGVFVDSHGVEVLVSAKSVPAAGWYVSVTLPTEEAFAPVRAMQQNMLLAAIILTLLAGVLTWWMLRRQLAPMLATAKALAALSGTNQPAQPLPVARQDEVGELIGGFNRLLQTLAQREEALKESEERYRTLVEWSREAIVVHRGGKLIYVNPAGIKMIGAKSAQDLVGKLLLDFIHPDFRQIVLARVANVTDHRVIAPMIEEKFLKLDGTAIEVEVQSTPIVYDGEPAIQVAMRDITERKRVDKALFESEQRHRLLFESSRDALMTLAPPSWRFTGANRATLEMFRAANAVAFTEHDPQDVSPERQPDGRLSSEKAQEAIATAMRAGEFAFEWEHRRLDGSVFPADVLLTRMDLGGAVFLQATVRDITAHKHAEAQLRAAEEQFRGLVEQHIAGIYIIQDGVFAYANPRFAEIFGYEPQDIAGMQVFALVAECDRDLVLENMRMRFSGEVKSIQYEFTGKRRNGTLVAIGAHGTTSVHNGKPAIIGVLQDISGKKRAEEEIRRHIEQLRTAFMSTVDVAMTMGEMRDPYTVGHERRVADLAVAIGAELGFDANRQEGLLVAGRLHDVGKFAVPADILSKPGKLSAVEFHLIQEHAQASYEVLKSVESPWPVAQVALQHHERMDGSGYPHGLKGEAILLEARIIAVADVVEAMSSHRPYRPGLGIDEALAEIERGRGSAYDPAVADACLNLFRHKGYAIPA